MIAAFLVAAAASLPTVVDAELAFARDAQTRGQWTAFRRYADRDAVMFTPQAVWARDFLAARKDPPRAIRWWPTQAYVSCDGRTGVTTGPWVLPDGKTHGFFTTIWQRTATGWHWVYDGGTDVAGPVPAHSRATVRHAQCTSRAPGPPVIPPLPLTAKQARTTPDDSGRGESADKTLGWDWKVAKDGTRHLRVFQWDGARYVKVLFNDIKPRRK
jgi:hypothetical protein